MSFLHRAAQTVGLLEFFFRRQDASGDIQPTDAAEGDLPGPDRLRLLVLGERTAMGLGVATHALGPAAQTARRLARLSGRGVSWSAMGMPDSRLRSAGRLFADADRLGDVDCVVLMAGITDTLCATPVADWSRQLYATLDALESMLPPRGLVLVAEIPPMDNAGSISRAARAAAGIHARRINRATRAVVSDRAQVQTTPFPEAMTRDVWLPRSEEGAYREMYETWGDAFADGIMSRAPHSI